MSGSGVLKVWRPAGARAWAAWLLVLATICQGVAPAAARGGKSLARAQTTETITVFGPRRYDRADVVTRAAEQFTIPPDAVGPFNVLVQNGAPDGTGRPLFGTVRLNGNVIFSSREFNAQAPALAQSVALGATNTLEVQFLSRQPAFVTVTVTATRLIPAPAPVITDFSPRRGAAGTLVTLRGTALKADTGQILVTFAGGNNTRVAATVSFSTATEVRAAVPVGAATGTIELTTAGGVASTGTPFIVETPQTFEVTVLPSAATAVQRGTATYVVAVSSPQTDFTQLARLSAAGLPAGAGATFDPAQITAGATSTLSVSLNNIDLAPGSYAFNVRGETDADGAKLVRTTPATLNVLRGGQTTLGGRVLSTAKEPIVGATASLDGKSATTDATGSFLLVGVTAGAHRAVMVDGRTASAPNRTYPVINEEANVVEGQANVIPYNFYLPPIDVQYEVEVMPGRDAAATTPRLPDYKLTVPAGANLRNRDGSPVTRMSVTPLPIDRIPAPLPPNVTTAEVWTAQPGGALSDIPIPVTYPNDMHADPGTQCDLYVFDHDNVKWKVYGTGHVSPDGRTVVPDVDPRTGRRYGLENFAWHFVAPPTRRRDPKPCSRATTSASSCPLCGRTAAPVDLATGNKIETATDISFGGARGGLELTRTHMTGLAVGGYVGRFGRGVKDNYDLALSGTFQAGGGGRLTSPEQFDGILFSYSRTDADGSLVFNTAETVDQLGDVIRKRADGAFEYLYADGRVLRFDSGRRLVAVVDRNGNTTTLTYTGGNLTRVTDAVGRSITLEYDSANRVTRATDPLGRVWRYAYEGGGGALSSVTDPLLDVTQYASDQSARLLSVTDPRGVVVKQITYGADDRVSEQKFADGGVERYSYAESGAVVTSATVTDPLGRVTSKRFNAAGYVIGETDALGQGSEIERSMVNNLPLVTTGPCGCPEVTREFDGRGNVTRTTDRLGRTTRYEYEPAFNRVTKMTDPLGRVTTYNYDARGNLTSVFDALGRTTRYDYDAGGQLNAVTDPLGHASRAEYDAQGNVTARVDALGNRTSMEYDGVGRLRATVDPLGRRTSMAYDALGRVVSVTDPAGATTGFTYDAAGNQLSMTNALGKRWARAYDVRNRLLAAIDPLGRMTRYAYDGDDELTAVTTPSGRRTRYTYDARGQRETVADPLGGVVRYAYDNRGNLTTLTDKRGNTTTFTYDELFRPKGRRDPLGKSSSVGYDDAGNVAERIDRLGRRTTLEYDALNRPARISYPDATVTYAYDPAGRRTRVEDTQGGSIDWSYDDANRLLSETTPAGVVSYTYNPAGQRASMTAADRPPVTYAYDAAGRLQTITQGAETFNYAYDALSRLAGLQRPNHVKTTYAYDALNRLERLTHTNAQNQALEDFRYIYNADDEIASITSLASAQLLPTPKTVTPADPANRIPQVGQSNYSFNDEGQTTTLTDGQGVTDYEWDARERMKSVMLPNGKKVNYGYDALGRRISRTADGATTVFLNDGTDIVLDKGSDGSQVAYLNGMGVDKKLRQANAGVNYYFLQDHLGSTVALVDATGSVVGQLLYEAFGQNQSNVLTRYKYTGREFDALTKLMYYRARWYDAEQGRFNSEDPFASENPLGSDESFNLYSYAGDNPITYFDPQGLYRLATDQEVNPVEPSRRIDGLLRCMENCLHTEFIVTSTSEPTSAHPPGGPHRLGLAVDLRLQFVIWYYFQQVAIHCGAQWIEPLPQSRNHFHIQLIPGRGHR